MGVLLLTAAKTDGVDIVVFRVFFGNVTCNFAGVVAKNTQSISAVCAAVAKTCGVCNAQRIQRNAVGALVFDGRNVATSKRYVYAAKTADSSRTLARSKVDLVIQDAVCGASVKGVARISKGLAALGFVDKIA